MGHNKTLSQWTYSCIVVFLMRVACSDICSGNDLMMFFRAGSFFMHSGCLAGLGSFKSIVMWLCFFFHTVLKSVLVWVHVFVAAWSCTLCRIETKRNTVCVLMAQRNILQSLIHNTCQQDASIVGFSFFLGRDRKPNLATLWFKNVAYFPGDSSDVKPWQETVWLEGLWQMLQIIEF